MTKRSIVFVDDDPAEIATFMRLYGGSQFEVIPVVGANPADGLARVLNAVGDSCPSLFVLDLYFPRATNGPTGFGGLAAGDFERITSGIGETRQALDALEDSVQQAPGDGKRLLREAHSVVHRSRALLDRWCDELGQSPQGGFDLLQKLQLHYPDVPALFYSRKATLADAKEAFALGALDILSKPDASLESSQATRIAAQFRAYADFKPPSFLEKWVKKVGFKVGLTPSGPVAEVTAELERK